MHNSSCKYDLYKQQLEKVLLSDRDLPPQKRDNEKGKRPMHDYMPRSLVDGDQWIEIVYVYGEEKNIFVLCRLHCVENPVYVFPVMKLRGLVPNSYIHVWMS